LNEYGLTPPEACELKETAVEVVGEEGREEKLEVKAGGGGVLLIVICRELEVVPPFESLIVRITLKIAALL